jgi:hypothetical protein
MGRAELVVPHTGQEGHVPRSAVEPIDRAAITNSPDRFRRNECQRGAVNGAIASRSGGPLMRTPIAVPRGIEHLDFSVHCQLAFLDNRFRCGRPAAAYVEFHMVGYCKRFDCDEDGNACGYGWAGHLKALEYTAECITRELQPAILVRWLSRRDARCPTCDPPIAVNHRPQTALSARLMTLPVGTRLADKNPRASCQRLQETFRSDPFEMGCDD